MSDKKILGLYKYQIIDNAVYMWEANTTDDARPFMYQPHHPDTSALFSSPEEAEEWAIEYINTH